MLNPTSNECVGAGVSSGCPHPDSQHICIYGTVHDFLDDAAVVAKVHVALYNPATLLSVGPSTEPIAEADFNNGVFVFPNLPFSSIGQLGRVAVAVGDKTNTTSVLCATGNQGLVAGETYRIDGYLLQTNTVAGWKPTIDVLQTGAYVAKFYEDAKPGNINLAIFETLRQPGVQLLREGAPDANVHYFGLTLGWNQPQSDQHVGGGRGNHAPARGWAVGKLQRHGRRRERLGGAARGLGRRRGVRGALPSELVTVDGRRGTLSLG